MKISCGEFFSVVAIAISIAIFVQHVALAAYVPPDNGGPRTSQGSGTR